MGWEIEVKGSAKKETELKKGDRVKVNIDGFKFSPIVRVDPVKCDFVNGLRQDSSEKSSRNI
jgi:hypothetical protein